MQIITYWIPAYAGMTQWVGFMVDKQDAKSPLVAVGVISSAHGIRGQVKIKSYTEPADAIAAYEGLLQDESGNKYPIKITGTAKNQLIATVANVSDRNQAETLSGVKLFVARELLPKPEQDEFYYEDLKNLAVHDLDGKVFAQVIGVDNYGAGDVLEVKLIETGKTQLFAFDEETVPEVNIDAGFIVVDIPEIIIVQ